MEGILHLDSREEKSFWISTAREVCVEVCVETALLEKSTGRGRRGG